MRRHFFLIAALVIVGGMILAGAWRLFAPGEAEAQGGPGGPGGAAAGRPGGGGGGGPGGGRPAEVRVVNPQPRLFTDRIEALGEAKGRQSVEITSDTTEMITRVLFSSGQFVRRGQTLVELKAEEQGAEVVRAQATLAQARREYERYQTLGERGFAPRVEIENRQAAVQEASAALAAVQARRRDRTIRAPFSGVIGLTDAAPGQLITPGSVIATLDDLSAIYVDFQIPENALGSIRAGQPLVARADAYPTEQFRGVIARIDTRVDAATRAVVARAEFSNPGQRIKPGMLLRVGVEQGGRQALAIPESAVLFEGEQAYVFVAAPGGAGGAGGQRAGGGAQAGAQGGGARAAAPPGGARASGGAAGAGGGASLRAERRVIESGVRQDGFVEILGGLTASDRIVADGVNRVNPNQPLRIAGAAGSGGARAAGAQAAGGQPGAAAR